MLVKRIINNKHFVFEIENEMVIIPDTYCLSRSGKDNYFRTKKGIPCLDKMELNNIPIGLSMECGRLNYGIIVINNEDYKPFIKTEFKNKKILFTDINNNINKIIEHYGIKR